MFSFVMMTPEEIQEFYNKCHDEKGRFCEGEGIVSGSSRTDSEFRGGTWYQNSDGDRVFKTNGSRPKGYSVAKKKDIAKEFDVERLKEGTPQQQSAYKAVTDLGIMNDLSEYNPVLAGTVPINVATKKSDLDVLVDVQDLDRFQTTINDKYGKFNGFTTRRYEVDGLDTVLANFNTKDGWPVEVFGQNRPAVEQHAFIHMQVEQRLLNIGGPKSVEAVRKLKASGLKTEPAFAEVFGIPGNPYSALVSYASISDKELKSKIKTSLTASATEFYNKCHDENGKFCEGEDVGTARSKTPISGKVLVEKEGWDKSGSITDRTKRLNLPDGEYALAGSAWWDILGIRKSNDMDIVVTPELYKSMQKDGWKKAEFNFGEGLVWTGNDDATAVSLPATTTNGVTPDIMGWIKDAKIVDGVPLAPINELFKLKRAYNRPKDQADIKAVTDLLGKDVDAGLKKFVEKKELSVLSLIDAEEFYNQCHDEDGKFCSDPVSGRTNIRDSDGVVDTSKPIPEKRGKLGASLKDPHEGTRTIDGIRGYDRNGKPVPGTDAYLEAHNISRDIFESRPYIKYEASKTDEALNTAFPKDVHSPGKNYSKGHRLFVGTAEDTDPMQTGGYIMYKNPAPDSPHGKIAPQIRPNAPVVTDKGERARAKTILDNSKTRLENLEKTTPQQFIKERRIEVKRAKEDLARAETMTPESAKAEAKAKYEVSKAKVQKLKDSPNTHPDVLTAAKKELTNEKKQLDKLVGTADKKGKADKENFKEGIIETKTLQLKSAENSLKNAIADPEGALSRAISRQKGIIKREQNAYEKTAAKYLFTPGETSARIDVNPDPQNIKNLVKGKGRIYLAMEGSIKNDAILTAIRKEDPTAAVVNVPSVTLWQQKNLAPEIPNEMGWFAQKYAKDRDVILIPDADGVKNNAVMSQAKALKSALLQNGAGQVYLATPPLKPGTTKVVEQFALPSGKIEERKGIDDHLGAGRGTLGQLRYKTFTEYPDYDLTHLTKAGGATGKEKMSAGAKPNAEKVLAAISGLVEDSGVGIVPLKTLNQTAGFKETQKTSARDARNTLEKHGVIKVEWVYDNKALGRGERVLNPNMSEKRRDELVRSGVIKEPNIYKKFSEVSFDQSPVITILDDRYIIKADKSLSGTVSELPKWKPPDTFKGWTSAVDGRPDSTGIAAKQESNHQKFVEKNRRAAESKKVVAGRTTKQRLADKKAPPGRKLVRSKAGAKRYGVSIGQPIPIREVVADAVAESVVQVLDSLSIKDLTSMVLLSSIVSEEELVEFYNRCHDENGKFCEGEDGPGRARDKEPVSGKFFSKGIKKVADAGLVGNVEVDGVEAKSVYEIKAKNGDSIRLYDQSGDVGRYADELLETQAEMHNLYPLQPPRSITVVEPDNLLSSFGGGRSKVDKDTFAIVYGNNPTTYVNADMLGVDTDDFKDGFQMPSAKTGDTNDMSYLITHEYGHHVDFARHSSKGYDYDKHPMYDNPGFQQALSRYGKSDARGIEGYAETFAEWHHSGGKTQNPAAIAMARYEGWVGTDGYRSMTASGMVSLTLQNGIHLAEMPPVGKEIVVIDTLKEDGPKVIGDFKVKEPSADEIARADKIIREVYEELGLNYPEGA